MRRTTNITVVSKAPYHCSSDISSRLPRGGPPALATRMSTPPNASSARLMSRSTSSFFVTSATMSITSTPVFARTSSSQALTSAAVRAHIRMRTPSAASAIAVALPMPLLAAVTSADFPRMPRSMRLSPLAVPEELRAVTTRDLDAADLVVPHHLDGKALAGLVSPEPRIQVAPRADFLGVERDDEVAFPNARPLAGPAGDHSRHHDALLERVREYAEPRAPRAAHHAPVAYELVLVHLIRVDGDRQRAPRDLVEIQIQDPEESPAHIEQPAAAVPGIRGARHDPAVEEVLPVRLELAEVGHVAATRAPLLGSCRAHGDDRRPSLESFGRCERRRPEP